MTTFPGSPRLQKGAIVGIDKAFPLPTIVIFQYNPDTMTRTLQVNAAGNDSDKGEALRIKGPPRKPSALKLKSTRPISWKKLNFRRQAWEYTLFCRPWKRFYTRDLWT